MYLTAGGKTDQGLVRANNEDNFYLDILFKAALINQNSICQQDAEEVVQGDLFTLINSIFQPTDQLGFAPYASDPSDDGPGHPLVKWIM